MSRSQLYTLLSLVAVGVAAGRMASTKTDTMSANDRSRWCTVRALVHDGTYAIGHRTLLSDGRYRDEGIIAERGWGTVDKALNPDTLVFYSSKPPLFSTIIAGVYWVVRAVTGLSIVDDQLAVVWVVMAVVNLVPFFFYCVLLGRLVEQFDLTDWARLYVFAAGCFGTFIITFQVVLNNHTPAACAALYSLHCLATATLVTPNGPSGKRSWRCALAGFFAAVAAACDLTAAAFAVWVVVYLGRRLGWRSGVVAVLGAAIPVAAWLVTNYLAIGQLLPAYTHQGGVWYHYPGSPWLPERLRGIERAGEVESKSEYALNLTIGHHGLFSLTPIFALVIGGLFTSGKPGTGTPSSDHPGRAFLTDLIQAVVALMVVTLGFYVLRSSNYGGYAVGPRWLFWLTPLLIVSLLPAADNLSRTKAGRIWGCLLLAFSVFSASYSALHPWSHPWLYSLMVYVDPQAGY